MALRLHRTFAAALAGFALVALTAPSLEAQTTRRARPTTQANRPAPPATQPAAEEPMAMTAPGKIMFRAHNAGYRALGSFEKWHFTKIDHAGGDITKGSIELEVMIDSVVAHNAETGEVEARLTDHLKAWDYFDAAQFPTAKIAIENATPTEKDEDGNQHYEADGTITIRETSQPLDVMYAVVGQDPLMIKGKATVNRTKFGVGPDLDPENPRIPIANVEVTFETVVPESLEAQEAMMAAGSAATERARPTGPSIREAAPSTRRAAPTTRRAAPTTRRN